MGNFKTRVTFRVLMTFDVCIFGDLSRVEVVECIGDGVKCELLGGGGRRVDFKRRDGGLFVELMRLHV